MSRFKRQTKRQPKADAILSADWHIRPDTPVCRTDNYWEAQERKIDFILALRKEHDCPLLVAGDLGNHPLNNGWPTWLSKWVINKFEGHHIIAIPGQHDLPNHKLDLWHKSGVGVLHAAEAINLLGPHDLGSDLVTEAFRLDAFPYGENLRTIQSSDWPGKQLPKIAIIHQMVIEGKPLWPDQKAPKGHQLLKQFPEYDLILSGDNHNAFVAEYEGRKLINPGSMMRAFADQEDHKPRVYLWYAESNEVVPVYLPIEQGVISREHIDMAEERSDRMDAYMTRLKEDIEIQLSYEKNMEKYFERFRTERPVKTKVVEVMG